MIVDIEENGEDIGHRAVEGGRRVSAEGVQWEERSLESSKRCQELQLTTWYMENTGKAYANRNTKGREKTGIERSTT